MSDPNMQQVEHVVNPAHNAQAADGQDQRAGMVIALERTLLTDSVPFCW